MPRPRPFRGCGRGFFGVRRLVGPLPGSGLRPACCPGGPFAVAAGFGPRRARHWRPLGSAARVPRPPASAFRPLPPPVAAPRPRPPPPRCAALGVGGSVGLARGAPGVGLRPLGPPCRAALAPLRPPPWAVPGCGLGGPPRRPPPPLCPWSPGLPSGLLGPGSGSRGGRCCPRCALLAALGSLGPASGLRGPLLRPAGPGGRVAAPFSAPALAGLLLSRLLPYHLRPHLSRAMQAADSGRP